MASDPYSIEHTHRQEYIFCLPAYSCEVHASIGSKYVLLHAYCLAVCRIVLSGALTGFLVVRLELFIFTSVYFYLLTFRNYGTMFLQ